MVLESFLLGIASNLTSWLVLDRVEPKKLQEQLEKAFHEAFTANADTILPLTQDENFTNGFFALARGEVIDTNALIQKALNIPGIPLTELEILDGLHQFCISLLNMIGKRTTELGKVPKGLHYFRDDLARKRDFLQNRFTGPPESPKSPETPKAYVIIPFRRNSLLRHHHKWIQDIRKILCDQGQVMVGQAASVYGGGGLGKTAMAVEYAWRFQEEYPGGVYWLQMDQGFTQAAIALLNSLQVQIPELHLPEASDEKQIINWLIGLLRQDPFKLVVLDNLVQEAIPNELNGLKHHILVTTRRRDLALSQVEIKLLSEDNALDILLAYAGEDPEYLTPENRFMVTSICTRLGNLPLALEIVGRLRKNMPWPTLSQRLDKEAVQLKGPAAARPEQTSVLTALRLAEQEFQHPLAKGVLTAAGYLHPEDINPAIISAIFQIDQREAEDILAELSNFSLMEPDTAKPTYLIHRLTQEVARLEDEGEEIGRKVAAYLNEKVSSCTESGRYLEGYHLMPHLIFLADLGKKRDVDFFPEGTMMNEWALYSRNCGIYSSAENISKACLLRLEICYGKENENYATALNNLAWVLMAQGRYGESESLYREALEISLKTIGPDHPGYATRLNNLALVYEAQGRYGEAERLCYEALEIGRKTIGPDHPDYATRLNNLALVLEAQGQYVEAERLYREALEIGRKTIGPDHSDYAIRLNNLAGLLKVQGHYVEAERLCREALDISQRRLGDDHPQTQTIQENLALLLKERP